MKEKILKRKMIIVVATVLLFVSCCICIFLMCTAEYDPHTSDRGDEKYCKEILDEVIRCLDEDDVETLYSLFSEDNKSKHTLEREIKKAMEAYDGKSVSCDVYSYGKGSYKVYYGYYSVKGASVKYRKVKTDSGKEYYIHVVICLVHDEQPEYIGVNMIHIKDENNIETVIG